MNETIVKKDNGEYRFVTGNMVICVDILSMGGVVPLQTYFETIRLLLLAGF